MIIKRNDVNQNENLYYGSSIFHFNVRNGNIQPTSLTGSGVREKLSLFDENYY